MSIVGLEIENFKGIDALETLSFAPITVFLGPNSSGKSSCIHALAALSQTLKLPNNLSPLTLDDEYASVHLGRWIEVLHRRSYAEKLRIGVRLSSHTVADYPAPGAPNKVQGEIAARFWFKSSLRTQDVTLEQAEYELDTLRFSVRRDGEAYRVTRVGSSAVIRMHRRAGFLLSEIPTGKRSSTSDLFYAFMVMQARVQRDLLATCYLGPFRQAPLRQYRTRGVAPTEVGPQGEAAITLLANEVLKRQKRPHLNQVAAWLATLGLGKKLAVTRLGSSDLFDVNVTLADDTSLPLADLGYGLSQVLPVLTQCSFAPPTATLLFEQPELHLHPLAGRALAHILAETALRGRTLLLETHSPELIHGFQQQVRDGQLTADQIAVYLVKRSDSHTCLTRVGIDADGEIQANWERGVSKKW
jgi:hypothetical protein